MERQRISLKCGKSSNRHIENSSNTLEDNSNRVNLDKRQFDKFIEKVKKYIILTKENIDGLDKEYLKKLKKAQDKFVKELEDDMQTFEEKVIKEFDCFNLRNSL